MRPLVDHSGPRMRDPAVLDVGYRFEQPRVHRIGLFHGRQLDVPVLVQDGRHRANDRRGTGAEKLEYLKWTREREF